MTTRAISVRRVAAQDWPLFADIVPDQGLEVLLLEVRRGSTENMQSAVADVASALAVVLRQEPFVGRFTGWLIALGQRIQPSQRVAALYARRDGLWGTFEKSGLVVPEGARTDGRLTYPDGSFAPVGELRIDPSGLPAALEITRIRNAVCLAGDSIANPMAELVRQPLTLDQSEPNLFAESVRRLRGDAVALRGFGRFDDVLVGVDIVGRGQFFDLLADVVSHRIT
jgi:hypothetical protein